MPDFGPQQYFLTYRFPGRLVRLPLLAEPIVIDPEKPVPVIFVFNDGKTLSGGRRPDGALHMPEGNLPASEVL